MSTSTRGRGRPRVPVTGTVNYRRAGELIRFVKQENEAGRYPTWQDIFSHVIGVNANNFEEVKTLARVEGLAPHIGFDRKAKGYIVTNTYMPSGMGHSGTRGWVGDMRTPAVMTQVQNLARSIKASVKSHKAGSKRRAEAELVELELSGCVERIARINTVFRELEAAR